MQFPVAGDGSGGGHWTQMSTKIGEGHKVLLGCASVNNAADIEAEMGLGILANHAYSILDMRSHSSQKLFRLRNPWGRVEWSGKFSDKWSGWTDELKKKLDWVDADDGMFWMCYDDLQQYFTHIYLCDVIPASWQSTRVAGYWRGESAGGCMNNKASWYKNPCYKFTVEAATHVVVVLSQPDLRMGNDKQWQSKQKSIGLVVYRTENGKPKKRLKKKDLVLDSTGAIGPFSNNREVVCEPIEPWVESWSYFVTGHC